MAERFYVNRAGELAHITDYGYKTYRAYVGSRWGTSYLKQLKTESGLHKFMTEHGWLELPNFFTPEDAWGLICAKDRHGNDIRYKWLYTMIAERM